MLSKSNELPWLCPDVTGAIAPVALFARISRRLTNELLFPDAPLPEPDV